MRGKNWEEEVEPVACERTELSDLLKSYLVLSVAYLVSPDYPNKPDPSGVHCGPALCENLKPTSERALC